VVERSWCFTAASACARHRVIPHTGVSLVLSGRHDADGLLRPESLLVFGSTVTHRFFAPTPDDVLVGVRLKPEWCGAVLGTGAADVLDRIVPVEKNRKWRSPFSRLQRAKDRCEARALLESLVRDRLADVRSSPWTITAHRALEYLRGATPDARVWQAARAEGLSERTLRRSVRAATGLSPKTVQRIERFHRTVLAADASEHPSWSGLAYRHGFSDQAHLAREVRVFAGRRPGELHAERRAEVQGRGISHA
jgi:AraC-like DNA-binding protein